MIGSILNIKTIEGYPGKRFHAGCSFVDEVERLAISRAKILFGAEHVNVQPHSGTSANLAVYFSVLDVGDRILSMDLTHGGHLSHGHTASITSRCFRFEHYGVKQETELLDYDELYRKAKAFQPKMIVVGASAYPRIIDYQAVASIAAEASAYLLADAAHIAGLIACGLHPSPIPHADFVTFTTYKTMMGGRGGVILCRDAYAKKIDSAVFPGSQGTSPVNMIAAKAMIFQMAQREPFRTIQQKTIEFAVLLAEGLKQRGFRIVTGGTDNHQVLVDVAVQGLGGAEAEKTLEAAGILVNRNVIPADRNQPGRISGIRLGSAGLAARHFKVDDVKRTAGLIADILEHGPQSKESYEIKQEVLALAQKYSFYC